MSLTLGRTLATLAALAIAPAAAAGAPGDVALVAPGALEISVSGDGSAVAFVTDLQLDRTLDRNEGADVYVAHLDLEGGTTFQLISKGLDSQSADGSSRGPEISADGSAVAFFSRAANLVDGDSNDREDVFVADVATGELRRANLTPLGGQADVGQLPDARPSLSADGAVIAFADTARELAPGTPLGTDALVYRREVAGGSTEFVDVGNDVSLSGDGKTVAYQRGEQVLADAGDGPQLVSRSSEGAEGDGFSGQPDVNDDGSLIAFTSEASNLAPEDTKGFRGVYLRDRGRSRTELVSLDDANEPAAVNSALPALSGDGRFVAFMAEGDPNGCGGGEFTIAVRDRDRESTFRASRTFEGGIPDGPSGFAALRSGPSVSAAGSVAGYPSFAANIVERRPRDLPNGYTTGLGAIDDPDLLTPVGTPHAAEDAGPLVFDFTICRRAGRRTDSRPVFASSGGTATAGEDYTAPDGSEIVVPGDENRVSVPVELLDDDASEPWESLSVAAVSDGNVVQTRPARGFITDDDLPDQGPIYFERSGEIVALDRDATDPQPITSGREPAVSRDGRRLAFLRPREDGTQQLWVSGPDGKDAKAVLTAAGVGLNHGFGRPAWSPDGTRVSVMALDGNPEVLQSDVVTLDPDSGAIDTVDVDIQSSSRTLSYSPDATRLAYDTRGRLMTLDLETGEQAQVGDGQTPSYGPNGDFVCVDGGRLWLQPADGSDAIPVARERASGDPSEWTDERPTYSPDGLAIAYVRYENGSGPHWLETQNLTPGSPPAALTSREEVVANPAWAPATGEVPPPPTVSIADASAAEGDPLGFAVTLARAATADVTVTATTSPGTAGSTDFTARSAQVTIPAGETEATFSVTTTEDALDEADETLTVALSGPSGATLADGNATGTIADDDAQPTVSIAAASAVEGNAVLLPVTLSAASGRAVTVRLNTTDGSAVAPGDYTAQSDALITVPAGQTSVNALVPTAADSSIEAAETFTATLSQPSNATLGTASATGTITDASRTVSVGPAPAVPEAGQLAFPVTLSSPSATATTVTLTTEDGTATAPGDYTAATLTITIPAGQTAGAFSVQTNEDQVVEPSETVKAKITGAGGQVVAGTTSATGTITDVAPRVLDIGPATTVPEDGQLVFPITLSRPSPTQSTVTVTAENGTATSPGDYTAKTETLTIPAGQTQVDFVVQTVEDQVAEGDETVKARITGGGGRLTTGTLSAFGTIADVAPRVLNIGAATTVSEGGTLSFPVTLSRSSPTQSTVTVTAENGTATSPGDYTAKTETLTIPAGQTQVDFVVQTVEDQVAEGDETVKARITGGGGRLTTGTLSAFGTIANVAPRVLDIGPAPTVDEGGQLAFPITLSKPSPTQTTVTVKAEDGTAKAPDDYAAKTATLTIPAGQTKTSFTVATADDELTEGDETVKARITGGGGQITTGTLSATGTIRDATGALPIARGSRLGGALIAGTVKVKLPGTGTFVDLGSDAVFPVGSTIDATGGTVELVSAVAAKAKFASTAAAKLQRARFSGGLFTLRQSKRSPLTTLVLAGKGCKRSLTADGKGAFAVKGRFATGRIGSARWTTTDACKATTVKVARGRVRVGRKVVKAGRSLTVRR